MLNRLQFNCHGTDAMDGNTHEGTMRCVLRLGRGTDRSCSARYPYRDRKLSMLVEDTASRGRGREVVQTVDLNS